LAILTTVTLVRTSNARPNDCVTAPKYVEAVLMIILMSILKLFLRQVTCETVGEKKNFDTTKM
jgi:hypothetical protein